MKYNKSIIALTVCIGVSSLTGLNVATSPWNIAELSNKTSTILTNAQQYFTKKLGELASRDTLALAGLVGAGLLGMLFYYNKHQKEQQIVVVQSQKYKNEYDQIISKKMQKKEIDIYGVPALIGQFMEEAKTISHSPEEEAYRLNGLHDLLTIYHHGESLANKLNEENQRVRQGPTVTQTSYGSITFPSK